MRIKKDMILRLFFSILVFLGSSKFFSTSSNPEVSDGNNSGNPSIYKRLKKTFKKTIPFQLALVVFFSLSFLYQNPRFPKNPINSGPSNKPPSKPYRKLYMPVKSVFENSETENDVIEKMPAIFEIFNISENARKIKKATVDPNSNSSEKILLIKIEMSNLLERKTITIHCAENPENFLLCIFYELAKYLGITTDRNAKLLRDFRRAVTMLCEEEKLLPQVGIELFTKIIQETEEKQNKDDDLQDRLPEYTLPMRETFTFEEDPKLSFRKKEEA